MFSGAKPHSADRLTMDLPNKSRMTWSTTISQTPSQDSESSFKLSMHDIGNDAVKFPAKPEHPDLPETSPNPSPTLTVRQQVRQRLFKAEEHQLWLYPEQGFHFRTEEGHHSRSVFQTQKRQKTNSPGETALS